MAGEDEERSGPWFVPDPVPSQRPGSATRLLPPERSREQRCSDVVEDDLQRYVELC